jgi:hypothetical protein
MLKRLIMLLILFAGVSIAGGIYKWVDEHGITVFSGTPPSGKTAEQVKLPAQPPRDVLERAHQETQRREQLQKELSNVDEKSDIEKYTKFNTDQKQFELVMNDFISRARNSNIGGMYELASPLAKKDYGIDKITGYYKEIVIPFFSDFEKLHNVQGVNRATGEHQQDGWSFYLFAITRSGQKKPFAIQVLRESGKLVIGKVIVGTCFKGAHPFCQY